MATTVDGLAVLYRGRQGRVEFRDVPPLHYVTAAGAGDPDDAPFAAAVDAVLGVSAAARQVLRRRSGDTPRALPLETLWWFESSVQVDLVAALALGVADLAASDRRAWRWKAMIAHPQLDEAGFEEAIQYARKADLPALDDVRFERWHEGRVAQVLHIGSCTEQADAVQALHRAIEAAGYRPRGRQHEIHLNDVRRTRPASLRTIIRQPVEVAR